MEHFQPRLILCPTDFSELATFALQYAKKLADCTGAALLAFYADPFLPPPHFTAAQMDEVVRNLEMSKRAAQEHLARYVASHTGPTFKTESLIMVDRPVTAIVKIAGQRHADLIVMGTHGRSGLSRVMLGSVTERVLREASCPVLTVRHNEATVESRTLTVQQILCPVNFTEMSLNALRHACSLAEWFKASLLVLHVAESPVDSAHEQQQLEQLCQWIPASLRTRCALKEVVRQGHAAEQIVELARSTRCEMIVLGAQHKRFFDSTVLGTTTVRVTRHANCPVLTVIHQ